MTKHVHSIPPHMNKSRRRSVKPFRSNERKRIRCNNQRHDARPSKAVKLKSSAMLVARSEELLKGLLEKYGSTTTRHDIFKGLLKSKLGDKFRRMQRKHRQKALAVASAVYHIISRKPNPPAALQTLVNKMSVSPPRGSDPCRRIVECLFDYGNTPEERIQNRQYTCTDANALRYIIRKRIQPQKVLAPDEGESVTKWAKREAKYRRSEKASNAPPNAAEVKRSITSESAEGTLSVVRPSERRYRTLQKWAKKGVFLIEPKDHGRTLVVAVTELAGLTIGESKRRPDKVRAAIENALDKLIKMAPAKPPTMALMTRRVFDDRRSVSSGPGIRSKRVSLEQA